jgi:hypothetical protein
MIPMNPLPLAAALLLLTAPLALAQQSPAIPGPGTTYMTPSGPIVSTGAPIGGTQQSTISSTGIGSVRTNGNGTSTVTNPDGSIVSVPTPR